MTIAMIRHCPMVFGLRIVRRENISEFMGTYSDTIVGVFRHCFTLPWDIIHPSIYL